MTESSDVGAVLGWGVPRLRDLPWRRTRDPWHVLVSEVMLQQTQALRVVPRWLAFVETFPTSASCAAAPLGEVLRLWQGLGYPRRARNLHLAAIAIVDEHGGRFPDTLDALLGLPGVGPYTARAVLAFAFEADVAVVDTNIARILARVEGRRLMAKDAQRLADSWQVHASAWAWNQSLMDLGATLCRPARPTCGECPLASTCTWHRGGHATPDPAIGSAGVSTTQAPFAGSDREARGRLMRAMSRGEVQRGTIGSVMGRRPEDADRLVADLGRDGLLVVDGDVVRLP